MLKIYLSTLIYLFITFCSQNIHINVFSLCQLFQTIQSICIFLSVFSVIFYLSLFFVFCSSSNLLFFLVYIFQYFFNLFFVLFYIYLFFGYFCLSFNLSIFLFFIHNFILCIFWSKFFSVYFWFVGEKFYLFIFSHHVNLFVSLFICLFVHIPICLLVLLSVYLKLYVYSSIFLFAYLVNSLFFLSVCPSAYLFTDMYVYYPFLICLQKIQSLPQTLYLLNIFATQCRYRPDMSNYEFCHIKKSKFEISEVYRKVCGKDCV